MLALLRLLFPVPLLIVGAAGISDPVAVGVSAVLALLPFLFPRWMLGRKPGRLFIGSGLGMLFLGAILGVIVSYNPALSLPMFFMILGSISLLFVVANSTASTQNIAAIGAAVGVIFALYFITQYAYFEYPLETGLPPQIGRAVSRIFPALVIFTPHPNAAATFLEGAFFLLAGLIFTDKRRRILWIAASAPVMFGVFISFSRGAWLGIALTLGIWWVFHLPKRWQAPVVALMGAGVGALCGVIGLTLLTGSVRFSPLVAKLVNGIGGRFELYRNTIELLRDYPLTGAGLGDTFALVYSRYQLLIDVPFLYYAHNLPLAVWVGMGLPGIIGLGVLLVQFYTLVFRAERAAVRSRHHTLFRAAWLGVTASLLHGLLDSAQFSPDRWTLAMLFFLLGMVIRLGRRTLRKNNLPAKSSSKNDKNARWRWGLAAAVLLALVVFAPKIITMGRANLGALYHTRADLAPDDPALPGAVARLRAQSEFDAVLMSQPENPVANRRLGMMALDDGDYSAAVEFLQTAYRHEPHNQPTLKALGYALLWSGQTEAAQTLFRQVDFQSRLVDELEYYQWWWGTQNRNDLARAARQMARRLSR